MSRGRPRKLDPTVPKHIDPRRLPKGAYWDRRDKVWYTILRDPKPRRQRIAAATATLADLHRILEDLDGIERGTVDALLDAFHKSDKFKSLAARTRDDYERQRTIASTWRTAAGPFGKMRCSRLTPPGMQNLIDKVAAGTRRDEEGNLIPTPTKANHLLRYLRRTFAWGANRGYAAANPFKGIEAARERKQRRQPDPVAVKRLTEFAKLRGARKAHTAGSCAPYLWMVIELGYLCRLRPIETLTLADSHVLPTGIHTNRRKGSKDSLVQWNPRLRAVVAAARELRDTETLGKVVPIHAHERRLFVAQDGGPLSKSGLESAWDRLIKSAIAAGIITPEQRFGLHDLKRKGITDTPGTRGEKQLASGHKTEAMLDTYDYSVPAVKPAGR